MDQLRHAVEPADGPSRDEPTPGTACTARAPRVHGAIARRCKTEPESGVEL
jgi:hypothetical protein